MDFNNYQKQAQQFAFYPGKDKGDITYPVLGLAGEAGEVAEKYKKILRDKNGLMGGEDIIAIIKECGDVLWYIQEIAFQLKWTLEAVAMVNIDKLTFRKNNGTLSGCGDDR